MMTIGITSIVIGIAVVQIGNASETIKGDGGMRVLLAQLNTAREVSISQRRNVQVNFIGTNEVQLLRREVPAGTTLVSSVVLEGGVQYTLITGVPDTPDGFGRRDAIDFGAAATIMFSTDGTLIDGSGNPANGTVFLAIPNVPRSVRAVTVLGATGRVRAYRWDGVQWLRV